MNLGSKTLTARFDRYINVTEREALNTFFGALDAGEKFDFTGVLGDFNGVQLAVAAAGDFELNTDAPVLPTSVSVTATVDPVEVVENLTLPLTASVLPADADDKSLTWTSSDDTIATVDSSGLVTGVAPGTVTITATSVAAPLVSGTLSVTVTSAPLSLEGVQIGIGDSTLKIGATLDVQASLLPLGYVGQGLTFSSSDDAVATVTSEGIIQARTVGTATITAAATEDNTKTDTVLVTVEDVTSIADAKITAASTMVTVNGVITKIMATNELYIQNGTEAVQVLGPSASFSTSAFAEGDFVQVSGPAINSSTPRRIGTTSLPSGTTLSINKIDFLTKPEVTPLVISESTYNTTDTPITNQWRLVQIDGLVPPQPWVNVVSSSTINRTFKLGATDVTVRISQYILADQITAVNALFTDFWKNDTVNYNGILSVFSGALQLLPSGAKDFTLVEAEPVLVSSITVTGAGDATSLASNGQLQLTAAVLPANADVLDVTWSSSNEAVATVSQTGLVSGVTVGNVTITATSAEVGSTVVGTLDLTVSEPLVLTSIELTSPVTLVKVNSTAQLVVTANPSAWTGTFTFTSDTPAVATVDNNGLVTGVGDGTAIITATSVETPSISDTVSIDVVTTVNYTNTEDFDFEPVFGTTYISDTTTGKTTLDGNTWTYSQVRSSDPAITGQGLMLRYGSSYIQTTIQGGMTAFSLDFSKAFTGTSVRQVKVELTNGVDTLTFLSEEFGTVSGADVTIRNLEAIGFELTGTVIVTITQNFASSDTASRQTNIDNFKWNNVAI
jgi:uncharacterized protein YjdB